MLSNCIPFTTMGQEHCLHYLFNPCSEADIILTISWMRKLESQSFWTFPKVIQKWGREECQNVHFRSVRANLPKTVSSYRHEIWVGEMFAKVTG